MLTLSPSLPPAAMGMITTLQRLQDKGLEELSSYNLKKLQEALELQKPMPTSPSFNSLMISPANTASCSTIEVQIVSAVNLKAPRLSLVDKDFRDGTYVVAWIDNEPHKRIRTVIESSAIGPNPFWNATMCFEVPNSELSDCVLHVLICAQGLLDRVIGGITLPMEDIVAAPSRALPISSYPILRQNGRKKPDEDNICGTLMMGLAVKDTV